MPSAGSPPRTVDRAGRAPSSAVVFAAKWRPAGRARWAQRPTRHLSRGGGPATLRHRSPRTSRRWPREPARPRPVCSGGWTRRATGRCVRVSSGRRWSVAGSGAAWRSGPDGRRTVQGSPAPEELTSVAPMPCRRSACRGTARAPCPGGFATWSTRPQPSGSRSVERACTHDARRLEGPADATSPGPDEALTTRLGAARTSRPRGGLTARADHFVRVTASHGEESLSRRPGIRGTDELAHPTERGPP